MTDLQKLAVKNQKEVIDEAVKYILGEREDIVITGAAGNGKSFVTRQIVERLAKSRDKVLICALAHQALGVAKDFLGNTHIKFKAQTIAAALHCSPEIDEVTGKKVFVPKKKYKYSKTGKRTLIIPEISQATYILIDECSQVSKEQKSMIDKLRKSNSIVIYIGDMHQLPPPNRDKGELISPVFDLKTFELIYPFRYGGEISEIGQLFRNEIKLGLNNQPFNKDVWKDLLDQKFDHFKIIKDKNLFGKKMIESYQKDLLGSKYISYTRYSYQLTGKWIRNNLTDFKFPFEVGDLITSKTNYYDNNILKISNGQNGVISGKRLMKLAIIWIKNFKGVWQFFKIEDTKYLSSVSLRMKYSENLNIDLSNVKVQEIEYWSHDIDDKKFIPTIPKNLPQFEKILKYLNSPNSLSNYSDHNIYWKAHHELADYFCNIQYAYALTSHTSQGSTYNNVFPSIKDIMNVTKISDLEKLQSLYVAITRAKTQITCIA